MKEGLAYRIRPFWTMRMLVGECSVSCRYFIMLSLFSFSASLRALIFITEQLTVFSSMLLQDRLTQHASPAFEANRVSKSDAVRSFPMRSRNRLFSLGVSSRSRKDFCEISSVA